MIYEKRSRRRKRQAQLGVPHSRIQVEHGFILQAGTCQILNFVQNPRQSQSVQGTELNWHILSEQGAILQDETCQILRLAEHPRWSPSVAIISQ